MKCRQVLRIDMAQNLPVKVMSGFTNSLNPHRSLKKNAFFLLYQRLKLVILRFKKRKEMFETINLREILSAFIVMFAIIDIFGSIPMFINIKSNNQTIKAWQAALAAMAFFIVFFFAGNGLLHLFGVDAESFAVAGSFVIFILALEMILGVEIIKSDSSSGGASIVPIAFPLIAGPGALTTLLSLRAEYADINIMIALVANVLIDFLVLRSVDTIQRFVGGNAIVILRKFFGVILLAIAVKLFATNLAVVIAGLK